MHCCSNGVAGMDGPSGIVLMRVGLCVAVTDMYQDTNYLCKLSAALGYAGHAMEHVTEWVLPAGVYHQAHPTRNALRSVDRYGENYWYCHIKDIFCTFGPPLPFHKDHKLPKQDMALIWHEQWGRGTQIYPQYNPFFYSKYYYHLVAQRRLPGQQPRKLDDEPWFKPPVVDLNKGQSERGHGKQARLQAAMKEQAEIAGMEGRNRSAIEEVIVLDSDEVE